jgi:hypothetical protein
LDEAEGVGSSVEDSLKTWSMTVISEVERFCNLPSSSYLFFYLSQEMNKLLCVGTQYIGMFYIMRTVYVCTNQININQYYQYPSLMNPGPGFASLGIFTKMCYSVYKYHVFFVCVYKMHHDLSEYTHTY